MPTPIKLKERSLTKKEVATRLELLRTPLWSYEQIFEQFGITLDVAGPIKSGFLAQYRIWAERFPKKITVLDLKNKLINRYVFELFLQDRELVSIRGASANFGMDEGSFRLTLSRAFEKGYLSKAESEGDFPDVYRKSLISEFHRRFPKLRYTIFATYSGFVKQVHEQIEKNLGVSVNPIYCLTFKAMGKTDFANGYDSITNEPMAMMFQIYLETKKPIQLKPDACSWVTYIRNEKELKGQLIGNPDAGMEKYRNVIKKYFNS